jgi:hypothetical protein
MDRAVPCRAAILLPAGAMNGETDSSYRLGERKEGRAGRRRRLEGGCLATREGREGVAAVSMGDMDTVAAAACRPRAGRTQRASHPMRPAGRFLS